MVFTFPTKHLVDSLFFLLLLSGMGCENSTGNKETQKEKADQISFVPGSICTVENQDSIFGVVKILVIDDSIAHLKIYKNKYNFRPSNIDIKSLSLGTINDKDGFGIDHVPIARKDFDNWKPVVVGFERVSKEDVEGYEIWKNR
jgi:hypothetical protein